jgi:hypothetical protein
MNRDKRRRGSTDTKVIKEWNNECDRMSLPRLTGRQRDWNNTVDKKKRQESYKTEKFLCSWVSIL